MRVPVFSAQPEYHTDAITTSHLTYQIVSSCHYTTIVIASRSVRDARLRPDSKYQTLA